jgi:hypothetical protein
VTIAATSSPAQSASPPPNQTISYPLADGDAGTAQTIAMIRRLVDEAKRDERVNRTAIEMVRRGGAFGYDKMRQMRAIYNGVLRSIGYVPDPVGKELLRPAYVILQVGAGDCDEINAILLPALLESIGIETRIITIAAHPAAPDQFTHVYCEANVNGRWIALDAARKGARWGNTPGKAFRRRVWSLSSDEYQDVGRMGLGAYGEMPALAQAAGSPVYRARMRRQPRPRRMAGLGFSWTDFANVLQAGTASATQIIGAVKGGNPLMPTAYQPGSAYAPATAQQDFTPLLIGAAVLGAALLLRGQS